MKKFLDIRQTPQWSKYLASLGWASEVTPGGISVQIRKSFLGSFVKVQRPLHLTKQDIQEIDEVCKKNKAVFCKLDVTDEPEEGLLESVGFEISIHPIAVPSTLYIDLDLSEEELWKNVSHSGKYSINRARREGTRVEFIKNPSEDQLHDFYSLAKDTSVHNHFYMSPFKEVLSRSDSFGEDSYLVFAWDSDGNLVGGKQFLCNDSLVFYSLGGTSSLGRSQKAGYLLMWESLLYFKGLGYSVLDLEGKDDPRFPIYTRNWGKFTYFKEKFGPIEKIFPYPYIKYYSLIFKFFAKATGTGF